VRESVTVASTYILRGDANALTGSIGWATTLQSKRPRSSSGLESGRSRRHVGIFDCSLRLHLHLRPFGVPEIYSGRSLPTIYDKEQEWRYIAFRGPLDARVASGQSEGARRAIVSQPNARACA
jgi:hypothetical protein